MDFTSSHKWAFEHIHHTHCTCAIYNCTDLNVQYMWEMSSPHSHRQESKTSICQLKLWVKIKLQEAVVDRYKTLKYYQVHSRHSDTDICHCQQKYFYFCFPTLPVNLTWFILISFHYILRFCYGLQKYHPPHTHKSHTIFAFTKYFFTYFLDQY